MIMETEYILSKKAKNVPWFQIILLLVSFLVMSILNLWILERQHNGSYLPKYITVQFDDEIRPDLSTFSSEFKLVVTRFGLDKSRIVYKSERGNGSIGYCEELTAWTFGVDRETKNYCENIRAISSRSDSLDISLILGMPWFVRTSADSSRLLPLSNVFSQRGCLTDLDCGQGICDGGTCVCRGKYFGARCHYSEDDVCETIRVDEQTDEFTGLRRRVSPKYELLRAQGDGRVIAAYNHPVYVETLAWEKEPGDNIDAIIYTGLRWMLTSITMPEDGRLDLYFPPSFHASSDSLGPIEATTEAVRFYTATDERPAPVSIRWFLPGSSVISEIDPVLGINTVLLCATCSKTNPCFFNNTCSDENACQCINGESGSL